MSKQLLHKFRVIPGGVTNVGGLNGEPFTIKDFVDIFNALNIQLLDKSHCTDIVDSPQLPAQKRKELRNIEQCLIPNNPNIIEVISNHTIGNAKVGPIPSYHTNIIDLGIVPINMQMIKKDVGLFNIFLNSSLYKEYLDKLELTSEIASSGTSPAVPPQFIKNIDVNGLLQVDHA